MLCLESRFRLGLGHKCRELWEKIDLKEKAGKVWASSKKGKWDCLVVFLVDLHYFQAASGWKIFKN